MRIVRRVPAAVLALGLTAAPAAFAQQTAPAAPAPTAPAAPAPAAANQAAAPAPLVLYFDNGSSAIRAQDEAVLDRASRAYNEGNPIVMIVSGATDLVGRPDANLLLSERRAQSVLAGLIARGIPAARFQVLAKGVTDPAVPTPSGVAEARNRRVEISWR